MKKDRRIVFGSFILILAILFVAAVELSLRFIGLTPWQLTKPVFDVTPGERLYVKHDALGYTQLPGKYTITLKSGYTFDVTHLPNNQRVTQPIDKYESQTDRPEIWIFGCSYTYGLTINDDDTFAWLLQERFPDYTVANFGVNGFGTVQGLVQFREALREKSPEIAIVVYAGFHDDRNTFSRSRRKSVVPWNRLGHLEIPRARFRANGELEYSPGVAEYTAFPLAKHSALAQLLDVGLNKVETRILRSQKVSQAVILDMLSLADQHGVELVIAGVTDFTRTATMLKFAGEINIATVDISVDLSDPIHNNLPHDNHPSAIANKKYADKLEQFLRDRQVLKLSAELPE